MVIKNNNINPKEKLFWSGVTVGVVIASLAFMIVSATLLATKAEAQTEMSAKVLESEMRKCIEACGYEFK